MSLKKQSIIAGILYISLIFIGPFTLLVFPEMFQNQTNILETVADNMNIINLWITGDILLISIEIVLSTLLFYILRRQNKSLSLFAYGSRLLMILIMIINTVFIVRIGYGNLDASGVQELFDLHHSGIYLWEIPFFIHIVIIGYISIKSSSMNTIIGYGLLIGAFGYLLDSVIYFSNMNLGIITLLSGILLGIVALSEIAFGIWLIANKKV